MKWDFLGRDESIDEFQSQVVSDLIGIPGNFEISRFVHEEENQENEKTSITYNFYFYSGANPSNVSVLTSTQNNWVNSFIAEGFTTSEIYYNTKPFTKSFFKLDFYDSTSSTEQKIYLTLILPLQQGDKENASIAPLLPNIQIFKPSQTLDFLKNNEGFFIYWLRDFDYLKIDTFFMSAKFFDAKLGVFVKMTNQPQSSFPNKFNFISDDKFYYKVVLDYEKFTYKVFDMNTNLRVGSSTPINWYEYINP